MDIRFRKVGEGEEIAYAGHAPVGGLYYVTQEGVFKSKFLTPFASEVEGCNGVAFLNGHLMIGGRSGLRVFSNAGPQPRTDLQLNLGVTGTAGNGEVAAAALGKGGFLVTSVRQGTLGGYLFSKKVGNTLPDWLQLPRYTWNSPGASRLSFHSPEWLETSESLLSLVFAARQHGFLFFRSGRERNSLFSLKGFQIEGLDLVSLSASDQSGLIIALDPSGVVCVVDAVHPDETTCIQISGIEGISFYKVLAIDSDVALLTNKGLFWIAGLLGSHDAHGFLERTSNLVVGFVPALSGIDMSYSNGHLVIAQSDAVLDVETRDIREVAAQYPHTPAHADVLSFPRAKEYSL